MNRSAGFDGLFFFATTARTFKLRAMADAGLTAVHELIEVQLTDVAGTLPNMNVVSEPSANPVPVIVTFVPPARGPPLGLTPVTVGDAYTKRARVVGTLVPMGR